jgi:hypothetical protein
MAAFVIHIARPDDGSILVEWINPRWRFGVSLEPAVCGSSWFFVSKAGSLLGGYLLPEWLR